MCMSEKKAPAPKGGAFLASGDEAYTRVRVTSMLPRVAFE